MEFHEKLQELRKKKGITQEELAELLFVSRTAVSKWETGRGYPNIDSLKAIAGFYKVTIDELLSGEELLNIAECDSREKERHLCDLMTGLLDASTVLLLFLPLFGQWEGELVRSVSLLGFSGASPLLRIAYLVTVLGMAVWGVATLALQNCRSAGWLRWKGGVSLLLNAVGVLVFILGRQPYAAALVFLFLAVKAVIQTKKR